MDRKQRLIIALLLGALVAGALARLDLGADTEASVLSSPLFLWVLAPALLSGWFAAPWFGRSGVGGWLRAALAGMAVFLALALPVGIYTGQGVALVMALPQNGFALAALGIAIAAPQVQALRQSRK